MTTEDVSPRFCAHGNYVGTAENCVFCQLAAINGKYQRAVWFLQDIAAMSRKIGSETAAHALAQLGEPRERSGD